MSINNREELSDFNSAELEESKFATLEKNLSVAEKHDSESRLNV